MTEQSPTRLEGMETASAQPQHFRQLQSPTRLEGMETKLRLLTISPANQVSDPP